MLWMNVTIVIPSDAEFGVLVKLFLNRRLVFLYKPGNWSGLAVATDR